MTLVADPVGLLGSRADVVNKAEVAKGETVELTSGDELDKLDGELTGCLALEVKRTVA